MPFVCSGKEKPGTGQKSTPYNRHYPNVVKVLNYFQTGNTKVIGVPVAVIAS